MNNSCSDIPCKVFFPLWNTTICFHQLTDQPSWIKHARDERSQISTDLAAQAENPSFSKWSEKSKRRERDLSRNINKRGRFLPFLPKLDPNIRSFFKSPATELLLWEPHGWVESGNGNLFILIIHPWDENSACAYSRAHAFFAFSCLFAPMSWCMIRPFV